MLKRIRHKFCDYLDNINLVAETFLLICLLWFVRFIGYLIDIYEYLGMHDVILFASLLYCRV